jgi:antitoxin ChpS
MKVMLEDHHRLGDPMHTTKLRKVGRSVMLAVPPAFLEQLHLQAGATVGLSIDQGCLVINPGPRPRYTLAQLLAASDYSQRLPAEQREWIDASAVGRELI